MTRQSTSEDVGDADDDADTSSTAFAVVYVFFFTLTPPAPPIPLQSSQRQTTHQIVVGGVGIVFREGDVDS